MATAFATPGVLRVSPFSAPNVAPSASVVPRRPPLTMVSQTNIAAKAAKVAAVKERLDKSMLIFNVSAEGLTVEQVRKLKNSMPDGTTLATVKNTLMRRAIEESPWAAADEALKQSNLWAFVGEDIKGSVKAYNDFLKENNIESPIRSGIFEGVMYDPDGIDTVASLPNKQELIGKIAFAVKSVPTKLARSVKAVPTKLAKSVEAVPTKVVRAIKLAVADQPSGGAPPAE